RVAGKAHAPVRPRLAGQFDHALADRGDAISRHAASFPQRITGAIAFCDRQRHAWRRPIFAPEAFSHSRGGTRSARWNVVFGKGTGLASLWRYLLAGLGLA